jgi:hypothetical protein
MLSADVIGDHLPISSYPALDPQYPFRHVYHTSIHTTSLSYTVRVTSDPQDATTLDVKDPWTSHGLSHCSGSRQKFDRCGSLTLEDGLVAVFDN